MSAVPLPGAGPTPTGLDLEPGFFWPMAFGPKIAERLFIDRGGDWIRLTFAMRVVAGASERLLSRPVAFEVKCAWPLVEIRVRWLFNMTSTLAIAAPSSEAASVRRLLSDPRARRTARFVPVIGDMVADVRAIATDDFPWDDLCRLAGHASDLRLVSTRDCLASREAGRSRAFPVHPARSVRRSRCGCEIP